MDPLEEGPPTGVKAYLGAGVTVSFEAARCLHAAECVRGLPEVFDSAARPWIRPDAADRDTVIEVVRRCPSGALQYETTDGSAEPAATRTVLNQTPAGRIYVRGELMVGYGDRARRETRAILCGCGASANTPYCDGVGPCHDEPVRDPSGAAQG